MLAKWLLSRWLEKRSDFRGGLIGSKMMVVGVKGLEISKLKNETVEVKTRRGRNIEGYRRP